ncbi:MAG TPA: phosphate ABC transporter substrate-binding protein PstS, partial [Thermoanaerobaculia bacterium]|nr:phosphate ABC transporter substrate-binding protein PstS [Thermoanaerobaculia bacterium]
MTGGGASSFSRWLAELWLLGAGAVAFALFAASLLHVPWSWWIVIAAIAATIAVFLARGRPALSMPHPIDAITAVALLGYARFATLGPTPEIDFVMFWGMKAKQYAFARGVDWAFLQNPFNQFAHVDYPPLVTLLFDAQALLAGGWPGRWLGVIHVGFGVATLLLLRWFVSEETESRWLRALATVAFLALALSPWIGLAEGPLIAYGTAGLLFIRRGDVGRGAVYLGLAANCKNEGLTLIAAAAVALLAVAAAGAKSSDTTITGAGSTFVQPLVAAWTPALGSAFGYTVQYSGVGSGAGIAAITANQVDFGASDAPLNPAQQSACPDCIQIPWALSATAVAYNVPGAPAHVNLDGKTISKIFLGQITNWNDAQIKALNKGASLPDLKITPIFRSDGSGTSYNFTDYLSAVNAEWKNKIGVSTQPAFPAGQGAKGSSGVAGLISRTDGAIGYVDVAYAIKNHIRFAAVRNAAGKFLYPSLSRIAAAAAAFPKVPANNELHI